MILVIDHYDSFVHNLARYVGMCGRQTQVSRFDQITQNDINALNPEAIILSPGPCTPQDAQNSIEIVKTFAPSIPILGVCLGHQIIGDAFGAKTIRAMRPVHGRASPIIHDGESLFMGLPSPFQAGRYHSLIVDITEPQSPLYPCAHTDDGVLMAFRHTNYPTYGIQFHPESVLTEFGIDIIRNFLHEAELWHADQPAKLAA